jgi:hypothetical protein
MATMMLRGASGETVPSSDWLIQITAVVVCGALLWFDRQRAPINR